jgi:uncharacterized membrane protein
MLLVTAPAQRTPTVVHPSAWLAITAVPLLLTAELSLTANALRAPGRRVVQTTMVNALLVPLILLLQALAPLPLLLAIALLTSTVLRKPLMANARNALTRVPLMLKIPQLPP